MLPPTPIPAVAAEPLAALAHELRALYARIYNETLAAADDARARFETPDGAGHVDPIYAADTAGCRAINKALASIVARHLHGAQLLDRIDEPAVVDSRWLHEHHVIAIGWDYSYDFGDPCALVVREVTR